MHLDWAWLIIDAGGAVHQGRICCATTLSASPWAVRWPSVVARVSDYPAELIRHHLGAPRSDVRRPGARSLYTCCSPATARKRGEHCCRGPAERSAPATATAEHKLASSSACSSKVLSRALCGLRYPASRSGSSSSAAIASRSASCRPSIGTIVPFTPSSRSPRPGRRNRSR